MEEIKSFTKIKTELETLILAVRIYRHDIRMHFAIEKYVNLIMMCGKRHMTQGTEPQNQEKVTTVREKETYKYVGILQEQTIK